MECEPPELLPSMPPMVARFEVEVSGPKRSPSGRTWAFSSSWTTPGCTRAHSSSRLTSRTVLHVAREVHHDGPVHRLAGERGAAAPREDGDAFPVRELEHGLDVARVARDDHADRLHLVHGGVGRVEEAGVLVEADIALDDAPQLLFEIGHGGDYTTRHVVPSDDVRALVSPSDGLRSTSRRVDADAPPARRVQLRRHPE